MNFSRSNRDRLRVKTVLLIFETTNENENFFFPLKRRKNRQRLRRV